MSLFNNTGVIERQEVMAQIQDLTNDSSSLQPYIITTSL